MLGLICIYSTVRPQCLGYPDKHTNCPGSSVISLCVCVCVNVYVLTSVYIIPSIVRNVTLDIDGTIPDECHAK
jgi:hypothetical protein